MQIHPHTTMADVVGSCDLIKTETDFHYTDDIEGATPLGIECFVLSTLCHKMLVPTNNVVRIYNDETLEVDAFPLNLPNEKRTLHFRAFTAIQFVE